MQSAAALNTTSKIGFLCKASLKLIGVSGEKIYISLNDAFCQQLLRNTSSNGTDVDEFNRKLRMRLTSRNNAKQIRGK